MGCIFGTTPHYIGEEPVSESEPADPRVSHASGYSGTVAPAVRSSFRAVLVLGGCGAADTLPPR